MAKKREPIRFIDIKTVRDALRWLKETDSDERRISEGEALKNRFPDTFAFEDRFWADSNQDYAQLSAISNWRSWNREYEKTEGKNWWATRGPGVLVLRERNGTTTSEFDDIEKLEDSYIFDENDFSDLEMEMHHENWKDYGRKDLRREIEKESLEADADAIETLMSTVTDEMIDEFVRQAYEDSGHYPEQDGGTSATVFPDVLEEWDGSLLQLGEMLNLSEHGYVVEVKLSPAAFHRGQIVLRSQDLPELVRPLASNPIPIQIPYDAALCDSPYLTCAWTGAKEIAERTKQEDTPQMRLPGVSERRRA